jgi:hypothetical protein
LYVPAGGNYPYGVVGMGIEQVRETLKERIKRGATFDELETIIRLTRGLRERERSELWNWAWHYDPAAKHRAHPFSALRAFLAR